MRSRVAAVAVVLLLAAGLGGSVSTASADAPVSELHLTDPSGDAHPNTDEEPTTASNVDVVAMGVRRLADRLVVRLTYDELRPHASRDWGVTFSMPRAHSFLWVTWTRSHRDDGRWDTAGWVSRVDEADEWPVRCPPVRGLQDYEANTLTLRIPARCYGDRPGVVLKGITTYARFGPSYRLTDSPFGDPDDPDDTRTPRLVDPA